jgi:AraC family transcriptional regulator
MSENALQNSREAQLKAGHFYGSTLNKRRCSDLILSEVRHGQGGRLPRHSHEAGFFCLLLDGDYVEFYGRRAVAYQPLSVMWHPPSVTHSDEIGGAGGSFFIVEVQDYWLERLREHSALPDTLGDLRGGELAWLALRLYREYKESPQCSPLMIEGIVLEMLALASRAVAAGERQAPKWLARAVEALHAGFRQNVTVNQLAAEAGVHPVHLSKVFRQFYGESVGDYAHRLRVKYACRLLSNPEARLSEVALAAGFFDQSHFTRVFKRLTGATPRAFRATLSKEGGSDGGGARDRREP